MMLERIKEKIRSKTGIPVEVERKVVDVSLYYELQAEVERLKKELRELKQENERLRTELKLIVEM